MRRGKRLRTIVAQSRHCASVLRNLDIVQVYCAISRSHNYSAQSRDSENAQHNLEIAQIPRLRGTYDNVYMKIANCTVQLTSVGLAQGSPQLHVRSLTLLL